MGLSLLAPLFLAGLALLGVPYLIHQIRRPERDPVPFSSLLFIPNVPRKVIERRRIQHILLMLLRMLLFLLLVLAFARPYWKIFATTESVDSDARHLILIDTSYSMATAGVFPDATRKALKILSSIDKAEPVGVIAFDRSPHLIAPIHTSGDPEAGSHERAEEAIEGLETTEESTQYLPALQFAQSILTSIPTGQDEARQRFIVHLISDFQRSGLPEEHTGWKLAPSIELDPVQVHAPDAVNHAITEISVRRNSDGQLRILGKVKNWSKRVGGGSPPDLEVRLFLNGEEEAANTLSVKGGNASQTAFTVDQAGAVSGWLELGGDDLEADNRRYFTWNPKGKKSVVLLADARSPQSSRQEKWPALRFFQQALAPGPRLPWAVETVSQDDLAGQLQAAVPDAVIACDLDGLIPQTAQTLLEYLRAGGQLLLLLNQTFDIDSLSTTLLAPIGIQATGPQFEEIRQARFQSLSWVDLEHPIFTPFTGTQFNDFSFVRFHNYFLLKQTDPNGTGMRILARLEDDTPAIVEVTAGNGRAIIWPFPLDLRWTNLPKTPRFLPLLHETLAYLCPPGKDDPSYRVGERVRPDDLVLASTASTPGTPHLIQLPGEETPIELQTSQLRDSDLLIPRHAGLLTSSGRPGRAIAVNVDAGEGDLTTVDPTEFELRLASAPSLRQEGEASQSPTSTASVFQEDFIVKREYGHAILVLIFTLLVLEGWYMSALKR